VKPILSALDTCSLSVIREPRRREKSTIKLKLQVTRCGCNFYYSDDRQEGTELATAEIKAKDLQLETAKEPCKIFILPMFSMSSSFSA